MNMVSRRNEYQADAFALKLGLADELASGLKKMSVKNLSNLTPHPLYIFFNYSHPTLLQRIEKLEN
jgi:STE24 endopeptidase